MFVRNLFDLVKEKLEDDNTSVAIYDEEFADPDRVKELLLRYSTKNGYLIDIENISSISNDTSTRFPNCNVVLLIYAIHSNKRSIDEKVIGSASLAYDAATKLVGERIISSEYNSEGSFKFVDIQKDDQIPFLSIHSLRVETNIVLNFND